jgi:hypothetical protein
LPESIERVQSVAAANFVPESVVRVLRFSSS